MESALSFLVAAFLAGAAAAVLRLPALIGFLAAGFLLNGIGVEQPEWLKAVADIGVTLLLFSIGLKLDLRTLLRRHVWVTSGVHMLLFTVISVGTIGALSAIGLGFEQDSRAIALVGFALSFSSTVFVVKRLERFGDERSFYGRASIGILLLQDIAAVLFIVLTNDARPSWWALLLLLLLPAMPLIRWIWAWLGDGELQLIFGLAMAFVPGYWAFEAVGLEGGLGALIVGLLLARSSQAKALSRSLLGLKDVLLVAFFLSIGFTGLPTLREAFVAVLLLALLPAKALLYVVLFRFSRLRNRTSALAGITLGNYSEFALIVGAVGVSSGLLDGRWLVTLSMAVALSFVFGAVTENRAPTLPDSIAAWFKPRPEEELLFEDRHVDIGECNAVVLGMGRVGLGAYLRLCEVPELTVVGIESDPFKVLELSEQGRYVIEGDATDTEFWARVRQTGHVEVAILALPNHEANMVALAELRKTRFDGVCAVIVRRRTEIAHALDSGADTALSLYAGAGVQLADEALEHWEMLPVEPLTDPGSAAK